MGSHLYDSLMTVNGKAYIGKPINHAKKKRVQKHSTRHGSHISLIKPLLHMAKILLLLRYCMTVSSLNFLTLLQVEAIAKSNTRCSKWV